MKWYSSHLTTTGEKPQAKIGQQKDRRTDPAFLQYHGGHVPARDGFTYNILLHKRNLSP